MLTGILGNEQLGDFQLGSVSTTVPTIYSETVTQTLSLTQSSFHGGNVINLSVGQSLSLSQSSSEEDLHQIILQHLAYTQEAFLTRIGISTNALTIGQTVLGLHIQFGNPAQTITFTGTATGTISKGQGQLLNLNQVVALQITRNLPVTQTLIPRQGAGLQRIEHLTHNLTLTQTVSGQKIQDLTLINTLTLAQSISDIAGPVKKSLVNQSIDITQSVAESKVLSLSIRQTLNLLQGIKGNGVLNFRLIQTLQLYQGFKGQLPIVGQDLNRLQVPIYYYGPPAIATIVNSKNRYVLYQVPEQTLVLRTPQLGDNQKYDGAIDLKRSMTGVLYTYIKRSRLNTIKYDFYLGRQKALETENFLTNHASEVITMTNWKGEVFIGFIINNPFEFTTAVRYLNESERVDIGLEFSGIKVAG